MIEKKTFSSFVHIYINDAIRSLIMIFKSMPLPLCNVRNTLIDFPIKLRKARQTSLRIVCLKICKQTKAMAMEQWTVFNLSNI